MCYSRCVVWSCNAELSVSCSEKIVKRTVRRKLRFVVQCVRAGSCELLTASVPTTRSGTDRSAGELSGLVKNATANGEAVFLGMNSGLIFQQDLQPSSFTLILVR